MKLGKRRGLKCSLKVDPEFDKCVDFFGFASRNHMVTMCLRALDNARVAERQIKWPPRFELEAESGLVPAPKKDCDDEIR